LRSQWIRSRELARQSCASFLVVARIGEIVGSPEFLQAWVFNTAIFFVISFGRAPARAPREAEAVCALGVAETRVPEAYHGTVEQGTTWESAGTFNPLPLLSQWKIRHALPCPGRFRHLASRLRRERRRPPLHAAPRAGALPETDYEKDGGVEDPRLQKFGDTYYLTYTGYNKKDAQLCLASSRDLIHWERNGRDPARLPRELEPRLDEVRRPSVPEKIDGKYWITGSAPPPAKRPDGTLLFDRSHSLDRSKPPRLCSPADPGCLNSRVVEPGPPPILTPRGIVLVYNGADDKLVYRTAVAVFDRHDPRKTPFPLRRSIFVPEKEWEKSCQVPNVVFVEGLVQEKNRFFFYYGAADKFNRRR